MFTSHFTASMRFFRRHIAFSMLNISGLTVGIACCIIVGLFILDETSFDRHHKDADRIYRMVQQIQGDGGDDQLLATTPPAVAEVMQEDIPEIEQVVRLFPRGWDNGYYVRYDDKQFLEENVCRADNSIFQVFTLPFKKGNPKTALIDPLSIIVNESMARKYFGNDDPIGKVIQIDDWKPRKVTAVMRDLPANSHFKIDFLVPLASDPMGEIAGSWNWNSFYTYFKIKDGVNISQVERKIRAVVAKKQSEDHTHLYAQRLTAIHLRSHLQSEILPNSDESYSTIFGIVAVFILLIVSVNYINLTIAQSFKRAKEIGIRKVTGAGRTGLIRQFLTESIVFSLVATLAAIGVVALLLPVVNTATGKGLTLLPHDHVMFLFAVVAFGLFLGVAAGIYPAFYQSSLRPLLILKGRNASAQHGLGRRKILVIAQFVIAITLLTGTIVIMRQMKFVQQTRLGLDKTQVLVLNDIIYLNEPEKTTLKAALFQIPEVKDIAASDGAPAGQSWTRTVRYKNSAVKQTINYLSVDEHFIPTLQISLHAGKNFSGRVQQEHHEIIINETAAKQLGIPPPAIGQQVVWSENKMTGEIDYATIVGVVEDFHFTSMTTAIGPFVFFNTKKREWKYIIKIKSANLSQTLTKIKDAWQTHVTSRPFQYTFMEDNFSRLYVAEINFKNVFRWITFISIFLSCLGLFSLSSFMTAQRKKEISIRKVLGASVFRVTILLSAEYAKLVIISAVISFPLCLWATHKWLENFVYHIQTGIGLPLLATLLILGTALFTVTFQTLKAALANPVKSLKAE
jgi:putative ABC transport system permease protein